MNQIQTKLPLPHRSQYKKKDKNTHNTEIEMVQEKAIKDMVEIVLKWTVTK